MRSRTMLPAVLVLLATARLPLVAADFTPARLRGGGVPPIPLQAIAGGEVWLEVTLSATGYPEKVTPLRTTPPYGQLVEEAVASWIFEPAREAQETVRSAVLVLALFRPPQLLNTPTLGEPPRDVARAGPEIPVLASTVMPLYPPLSTGDGVVLVDLTVSPGGAVSSAAVVGSSPGFDRSALDAVSHWTFTPAHRGSLPVASHVYVIVGFRQPVVPPPGDVR